MGKRVFCLFLAVMLALTGCTSTQGTLEQQEVRQKPEMKVPVVEEAYTVEQPVLAGEITLELPVSMVRAMVNCHGYQPDREKYVLFAGEDITGEFRVVREADWAVVYTGTIQKHADAVNVGLGDFSAVTEAGRYYIEQGQVGRSYSFAISETVYEPIFLGLIENLLTELPAAEAVTATDICNVSFGMHSMLLALQCHGALFEKDNNLVMQLLELADWLMSFQDAESGSMLADYEATAAYCGVLAQSAAAFGKYDANVAKDFHAAAKNAWKWMEKNPDLAAKYPSAEFYAAAQLYKAESSREYQATIERYLQTRTMRITEDRFAFYGSVIYLNTIKGTDRDLCTKIMQELVDETEDISRRVKEHPYLVYSDDITQNLQKVLLICFVDYITPSNEYAVILENTLHYLSGRNETGGCYLDENAVWASSDRTAEKNLEWNGILLFCLSNLLNTAADDIK